MKNSFPYFTKLCLIVDSLSLERHLFVKKNCDKTFVTVLFGSILFDVGELHQHLFCIKKYRKDT
ncbi:hypothetical protein, partial [Enterococcus faecium]|uniref:hypothetical protein n=1 Tax=Enterococcus faecium TaxID=1352 RepID=UPI001A914ADC